MKRISLLCSLCTVIALASNPAIAQTVCDSRIGVVARLAEKYGEAPVAHGVTNKGGLVEVLTTVDGGTWTIILSTPEGISCLVAIGEGWRTFQPGRTKLDPQT